MTLLRQRMIEDMQVRNLAPHTQATYVLHVSLFARHFRQSPELLGPEEIRDYQLYLTNQRKLAPSSIVVTTAALRFLYNVTLKRGWNLEASIPAPRQPKKLPVVLSRAEVLHFLGCVEDIKHQAILTTCYAAGLRISEAVRLTTSSLDKQRMVIRVAQGKGHKDRYVMLSPKLLDTLRDYWRIARPKEWLFPGYFGQPITTHAVEHACRKARLRGGIPKPISPRSLAIVA
jgi:integrase/recombinase XerD